MESSQLVRTAMPAFVHKGNTYLCSCCVCSPELEHSASRDREESATPQPPSRAHKADRQGTITQHRRENQPCLQDRNSKTQMPRRLERLCKLCQVAREGWGKVELAMLPSPVAATGN